MNPRFYYSVCQFGAEKAVKAEVSSNFAALTFAFSRPGLITFKDSKSDSPEIENPMSIFTRLWGVSIGQAKTPEAIQSLLGMIPAGAIVHAFDRDLCLPGDEEDGAVRGSKIQKLLRDSGVSLSLNQKPVLGKPVFDLIWVDEGHLFLGRHLHQEGLDPAPGNFPDLVLPKDAPSRAYLKLEEAVLRFHPKIRPGMQVLEVGCSPGGASTSMLTRGMSVLGVDPRGMDPSVFKYKSFRFVQKMAKDFAKTDLGDFNPEWLVLDMNLAPLETLDEMAHVVRALRERFGKGFKLHTGFLTIKLNDWKFAERIPLYLKRISELGFQRLTPVQLCSNRQEFFVYAEDFR